jgi:rhodanese-related sulfurtransferase
MTDMNIDDILKAAQARAKQLSLPYAGALKPTEAYALMQHHDKATLVDVRTAAEWDWVGRVPDAVEIEIMSYPSRPNANFMQELEQQVPKDAVVMFLCRSGARSHNAAMMATEAGYQQCYNVLEGFEGDRDAAGHRKTVGGWCFAGLPWQGA